MEGVQPGGVEGVGHDPAHGAHVVVPVGGAGAVAGAEPQPGREAVVLGGMGVHDEDLRLRAVPLHLKRQGVLDLCRDVCRRDAGVVLDAARPADHVLFAAALRIGFFKDGACVFRPGVVAFQRDEVGAVCGGGQRSRSGFEDFGRKRFCRRSAALRGGGLLPAERKGRLRGGQRPDDERRQTEHQSMGKNGQRQHQRRRPGQTEHRPGPEISLPAAHGGHLLPS